MNKAMVTFKRFRSMGLLAGLFFMVGLLAAPAAMAQALVEATILTTNVDVQKKKLYVEINYTPKPCGEYQLRFKLQKGATGVAYYTAITLDSVITNSVGDPERYIEDYTFPSGVEYTGPEAGKTVKVLNLDNTAVGGYYLRFHLDSTVAASDNPTVCMETYKHSYRCKYCAVGNADVVFGKNAIDPNCIPESGYPGDDLVWCKKRQGGANNWEIYVQDPRDCNVYRAVKMPNGKWWFAENLNYQQGLTREGNDATLIKAGIYFCPGLSGGSIPGGPDDDRLCNVYGALYPWATARALDGGTYNVEGNVDNEALPVGTEGNTSKRGICPPNWFLPNDADWGMMLNYAEGCSGGDATHIIAPLSPDRLGAPCTHFSNDVPLQSEVTGTTIGIGAGVISALNNMGTTTGDILYYYNMGEQAGKRLKAQEQCYDGLNCDNSLIPVNSATVAGVPGEATALTRWMRSDQHVGIDYYGMSIIPAGFHHNSNNSGRFYGRGQLAVFLSSTYATTDKTPILRMFYNDRSDVRRFYFAGDPGNRNAYSVRCIR